MTVCSQLKVQWDCCGGIGVGTPEPQLLHFILCTLVQRAGGNAATSSRGVAQHLCVQGGGACSRAVLPRSGLSTCPPALPAILQAPRIELWGCQHTVSSQSPRRCQPFSWTGERASLQFSKSSVACSESHPTPVHAWFYCEQTCGWGRLVTRPQAPT